jgi:TRAP-type C4-dicarboxylate transport system substrate-binding protein
MFNMTMFNKKMLNKIMLKTYFINTFLYILCGFLLLTPVQARTFKIATLSPDGSAWMQSVRTGSKEIEKRTQGRVKFKFYPGGVMGDDQSVLRKIRIGQLHGGLVSGSVIVKKNTDYQVYGLLLKYRSQDEIDQIRKVYDPIVKKGFEQDGFIALGLAESGFAYIMSVDEPVTSVTQLRKQKVWVPANDASSMEAVAAFGVTPIPLPYGDVLAGLQTGMINTVAMSPIGAISLQWHTQIKYLTDLPLMYSLGIFAFNAKAFRKIKPGDQKVVREVMGKIFDKIDTQNKRSNDESLAVMKELGITFVTPTAEEKLEWKKLSDSTIERMEKAGLVDKKTVSNIDKMLEQYRSR